MTNCELPETPNSTVHQALAAASEASKPKSEVKNFSVPLPEDLKENAQFICERHGTNLSTYLRECARALVKDYGFNAAEE